MIDPTARDFASVLYTENDLSIAGTLRYLPRQSDQLPILIQNWLHGLGKSIQNVRMVVVVTGPGATTSVRLGVATAQAMGDGLSVPVIGVSTFQAALDWACQGVQFIVTPGRRGHWVMRAYTVKPVGEPVPITDVIVAPVDECIRILNKIKSSINVRWLHASDTHIDQLPQHIHVKVGSLCMALGELANTTSLQARFGADLRIHYAYDAVG